MGFWGWVWWGTSRSQLAKTMLSPSFTANARRSATRRVLNVWGGGASHGAWCLWTSSRRPLCLGPLCDYPRRHKRVLGNRNPTAHVAPRGPSCMGMALPRALASALAAVLDDCGFSTLDDFATYLEADSQVPPSWRRAFEATSARRWCERRWRKMQ